VTESLESVLKSLLLSAAVTTGLQAGTYYTWASGVMPELVRLDDRTFVHAMQQMSRAIVNPVFMASFLGAPLLAAAAAGVASSATARAWVLAGAGLAVATVAITVAGNVPLNTMLDRADLAGTTDARRRFEKSWVRLNTARAVTSTVSLAALVWAALCA
jgi:uncharacterized membrane protein